MYRIHITATTEHQPKFDNTFEFDSADDFLQAAASFVEVFAFNFANNTGIQSITLTRD